MPQHTPHSDDLPVLIQGGMGIGVSSWELAGTVAAAGHMGVVAGTGLEFICARRLQLGDPGGHVRRALASFPVPTMAQRIRDKYFVPGGIEEGQAFKGVPMYTLDPSPSLLEMTVVANFVEVFLAKERGRHGVVGVNYMYKIQMPLLAAMYGAVLAGVDYVLMGAGSPEPIPSLLTQLSAHADVRLTPKIQYGDASGDSRIELSPRALMGESLPSLSRPRFLAIVASAELAERLLAVEPEGPDGFVVERNTAGGHNAPPRGPLRLDEPGQPIYGPLDDVELHHMVALGVPFWLAGSYGNPEALREARMAGAAGIQVGTAFAFCRESGLDPDLRSQTIEQVQREQLQVFTDPRASPSGFPFKVVQLPGTLADKEVYDARSRVCDAGFLRVPFTTDAGGIGYRCPAEPERSYSRKRGRPQNTDGRKCLCNSLLANIGLGQVRRDRYSEPPLVTAGDDVSGILRFIPEGASSYGAEDVIAHILGSSDGEG